MKPLRHFSTPSKVVKLFNIPKQKLVKQPFLLVNCRAVIYACLNSCFI